MKTKLFHLIGRATILFIFLLLLPQGAVSEPQCSANILYTGGEIRVWGATWANAECINTVIANNSISNISNGIWSINKTLYFNGTSTTFYLNSTSGLNEIRLYSTSGTIANIRFDNIINSDDSIIIHSWNYTTNEEDINTVSRASLRFSYPASGSISNWIVSGLGASTSGETSGIYLDNLYSYINFYNITVLRNYNGFMVYNSLVNISNSNISNSVNNGVAISQDNQKVEITNTIFNNNTIGIYADRIGSAGMYITNISALANRNETIFVSNGAGNKNLSNVSIEGGLIIDSNIAVDLTGAIAMICPVVYPCTNITINGTTISNVSNANIQVTGMTYSRITNNTLTLTRDDAITLYNSTHNEINDNNISVDANGTAGIWFDSYSYDNYARRNRIDNPAVTSDTDSNIHIGTADNSYNNYVINSTFLQRTVFVTVLHNETDPVGFTGANNVSLSWSGNAMYKVKAWTMEQYHNFTVTTTNTTILLERPQNANETLWLYRIWNVTLLNASAIPITATVMRVDAWNDTYKKWYASAPANYTIGDNPISTTVRVKANGSNWNTYISNSTGYINFNFTAFGETQFEIGNITPPILSIINNTKTNDAAIKKIFLNNSESITFYASADQTISTWNWYIDNVLQSNNYNHLTTSWSKGKYHYVSLNGSNAYGLSNTLTWGVNVYPAMATATIGALNETPADEIRKALENKDAPALVMASVLPFTNLIGAFFYAIVWFIVFVMLWIKTKTVNIPMVIGIIFGGLIISFLPEQYQLVTTALIVMGIFAIIYIFFKGRG